MGQAAGTAAAYCAKQGLVPIELKENKQAVFNIQQQLLRDDQFIIGLKVGSALCDRRTNRR